MIIAEVSAWAWFALAYPLTIGIKAFAEVLQTRIKLAFALKLLRPRGGQDDQEAARKDLDAVGTFITPPVDRTTERPPSLLFRPKRNTGIRSLPAMSDRTES